MIKNREIIQSLPQDKKIAMIADGNRLGSTETNGGIPRVMPASLEAVNSACGEIYPDFSFLANSFNNELISSVAADLSLRAKEHGINLLFTPEGKPVTNPYSAGISEDNFYTGAVIFNIAKSVKSAGVVPCVTGYALTNCDVDYLDVFPDARAVYEYLFSTLDLFTEAGNVFMTAFTRLSGKYEKINCETVSKLLHSAAGENGYVICSQTDRELTVESVSAGNTFSYASDAGALKAAYDNYGSISSAVERGDASRSELEAACRAGSAISPLAVDEAVDKIADFALYCNSAAGGEKTGKTYDMQALSLQAAEESTVLLKNDGVLPLRGSEKVGVIGQPAFMPNGASRQNFLQTLAKRPPFAVIGAAQGYTLSDDRNDELLAEAVNLAKRCDTVLLFLEPDKRKEGSLASVRRLKLPANRLALIGALKETGVKIIAVLTTPRSVDVSFDGGVSALLISPVSCMRGGEALINILCGKSPSGKLANTLYADTDAYFEKIKRDKDGGKIRIGTFIGYRYYTTAKIAVKYSFGHGLGYTAFSYSNLSVQGEQILVTVKNTGNRDGGEVVQLYTGKPDSKIIRPVKELKSYIKVYLRAGEAKTLRFRITPDRLAVFCPETGKKVTEGGSYNIYAGSSVNDIKVNGKITVYGAALKPDGYKLSDYIPTVSNVVEDGYTLSPVQKVSAEGKKLRFAGLLVLLAAVVFSTIFSILNLVNVMSFSLEGGTPVFMAVILILFAVAVIMLIVSGVQISRAKAHPVAVSTRKPEAVKVEGSDSLDSLFEQEFGEEEEEEEKQETSDDGQEILKYLDDTLTFSTAAGNLCVFCAERGLNVSIGTARKILSAFASSRLILIKGASATGAALMRLICEFFGVQPAVEKYKKCSGAEEFLNLGGGSISEAVNSAEGQKQFVRPVCADGAELADLGNIITPFAKYLKNPESGCTLSSVGDEEIKLAQNLWFVFALSDNSFLKDADLFTAGNACVIEADCAPSAVKSVKTELSAPSYYQLKKLSDAAKRAYSLDEDKCWKKVDKLEKFVCSHTPYAIGNKEWQSIERFVSAYLASGGDEPDALDNLIAAKLAVAACAHLNGKLSQSDGSVLSAIENIFGEEHIAETKKILKYSGISPSGRRDYAGK